MKKCNQCHKKKPNKMFIGLKTKKQVGSCKECRDKKLKHYYNKSRIDPEGYKTYHREYKRKYRAQLTGTGLTSKGI